MQTTGIYEIIHKESGCRYIGSTQYDFEYRWNEHRRDLKKEKHTSPLLQEACNKEGLSGLEFVIVLFCEPEECVRYEQFFLDYWSAKDKLLNANPLIEWDFSDRGGRGYIKPRIAYERRENRREFNKLFKAMRKCGIQHNEATRIAEKFFPFSGFITDEDLI